MEESYSVDIDHLVHETDKAYLISIGGEEHWLPKSKCEIDEDETELQAPEWLLIEKGLV